MEQKTVRAKPNSLPRRRGAAGAELERLKHLITVLDDCCSTEIPPRVRRSLKGLGGLKRIAAARTILLTDYGGTNPGDTCAVIAEDLPDLYAEFGEKRALALCEEIQHSEVAEQSALYQEMFQAFNVQYFAGQLPDYKILVVYDVWFWETQVFGISLPSRRPLYEASGFIDFEGRVILIRFLPHLTCGISMVGTLLHEMAHAASDGDHGENWQSEMARLKQLGAPVDENDF